MPVYEYECDQCEKVFEIQQRMSEEPLKSCPECEGEVRKLMSMSSFQLKGGGWYADGYSSSKGKSDSSKNGKKQAPACSAGGGCAGCPASAN